MARWHFANVLQTTSGGRRLWRFTGKGDRFLFEQEIKLTLSEPAPEALVAKDWQNLVRRKLNIAWLPLDKVFLRAVQLPTGDPAEMAAMVELQLEKLSPLPVTHIVWSLYPMVQAAAKPEEMQTAILIIAARAYVEELLGELETQGYLADRLETPGLDQLLTLKMEGDGVWVIAGGENEPALVVWHYGGKIQNLSVLALPAGQDRAAWVKSHFEQISWTGELEGWLTGQPMIRLVAGPAESALWGPLFHSWCEHGVEVLRPAAPADLAAWGAQRSAAAGSKTNLLPPEFAARYHQQFVDRLWIRSLVAVAGVYMICVLAYFAARTVLAHNYDTLHVQLSGMTNAYVEAQRDVEQIKVLKDRQVLKYAALDCWKAVAENLPDTITLEDLAFQNGKLELHGMGEASQPDDVNSFNEAMRHVTMASNGPPLFAEVTPANVTIRTDKSEWKFDCSIKSLESP